MWPGFFDGEGSVGIYRKGKMDPCYRLIAQVTQNRVGGAQNLMVGSAARFGGSVSSTGTQKKALIWQISGSAAARFLAWIQPFIIFKKKQVDLAILWASSRPKPQREVGGRMQPVLRAFHRGDDAVARKINS